MSESPNSTDNPEVDHQETDVHVRAIIGYGVGLAAVALVVHVFLWWLQGFYATQTQRSQTLVYPMAVGQGDQLPPEPRLQNNPQQALRELLARQRALLDGARVPIEEAMRTIVQRGLPARETAPAPAAPDVTKTRDVTGPSKADSAGHGP
jgi:hypothetical protein